MANFIFGDNKILIESGINKSDQAAIKLTALLREYDARPESRLHSVTMIFKTTESVNTLSKAIEHVKDLLKETKDDSDQLSEY